MSATSAAWTDVAALLRQQRKMARLSLRGLAQLTNVCQFVARLTAPAPVTVSVPEQAPAATSKQTASAKA